MALRFFFYGTLLDGSDNDVARVLHRLLRPIGPASVRGHLHAIPDPQGWFPALVTGDGTVQGALYEARAGFAPDDLARMDAYEDFDPAQPASSLYLRRALAISTADGAQHVAETYLFNQPLPAGSEPIAGGSFRN